MPFPVHDGETVGKVQIVFPGTGGVQTAAGSTAGLPTSPVQPPLQLLYTTGTLIAVSSAEVSGWNDLNVLDKLKIGRTATDGTYAFEIDWSRDGAAVDFTEAVTVGNNTTVEKAVAARYARFRVRNTSAVTAFSAHRTTVYAR